MTRAAGGLTIALICVSAGACGGASGKADARRDDGAVASDAVEAPGADAGARDVGQDIGQDIGQDTIRQDTGLDAPRVDAQADAVAEAPRPVAFASWPGDDKVASVSVKNAFGSNLSGIVYQPAAGATQAIMWAVQNAPPKVYRLAWNGTAFASTTVEGWGSGKTLTYPNGSGTPDSEGLTRTEWEKTELYVAAEENSDSPGTSRMSILRYDLSGTATALVATHEWNLTPDLPAAAPNGGLEAITWIPDAFLVQRGFHDESTGATYDPATHSNHGTGIFLVGVEATGMIYGYVVDHSTGGFERVATFSSTQAGVMALAFDRDTGTLWAQNDLDNRLALFDIDTVSGSSTKGRFVLRASVPPPSTLTSTNNEGITMAPESECASNRKAFFWADDNETNGYALRRDLIPCGRLFQ